MYYIWTHLFDKSQKDFFDCGIEQFEGWDLIEWQSGKKITSPLPETLHYFAINNVNPDDYVMTGSTEFLVSGKIVAILNRIGVSNIEYYKSSIHKPNGEMLEEFFTVNILSVVDCINKKKSSYRVQRYGPVEVNYYSKLVFRYKKIDQSLKLFRIHEREGLVVAHESVVNAFHSEGITGIRFHNVDNYAD